MSKTRLENSFFADKEGYQVYEIVTRGDRPSIPRSWDRRVRVLITNMYLYFIFSFKCFYFSNHFY